MAVRNNFPKCEVGRSVVGPQYIHWCHVLLFATLERSARRVKAKLIRATHPCFLIANVLFIYPTANAWHSMGQIVKSLVSVCLLSFLWSQFFDFDEIWRSHLEPRNWGRVHWCQNLITPYLVFFPVFHPRIFSGNVQTVMKLVNRLEWLMAQTTCLESHYASIVEKCYKPLFCLLNTKWGLVHFHWECVCLNVWHT